MALSPEMTCTEAVWMAVRVQVRQIHVTLRDLLQGLLQVGDEVGGLLQADIQPDDPAIIAALRSAATAGRPSPGYACRPS